MKIIDISKCSEDVINYINKFQNNYFELEKLYKEKESEIERLNNIINELEKWLAKEYISGCYEELYRIGLQDSYDKLQELKGSNENG